MYLKFINLTPLILNIFSIKYLFRYNYVYDTFLLAHFKVSFKSL